MPWLRWLGMLEEKGFVPRGFSLRTLVMHRDGFLAHERPLLLFRQQSRWGTK
jgi:hypothetical protein